MLGRLLGPGNRLPQDGPKGDGEMHRGSRFTACSQTPSMGKWQVGSLAVTTLSINGY